MIAYNEGMKKKHPSTVDVLRRARRIIKDCGWARFSRAQLESGQPVSVADPTARRFCLMGAVQRAQIELHASYRVEQQALDALRDLIGDWPPHWNDAPGRTKEEVVAKLSEAIKWVQNEGIRS